MLELRASVAISNHSQQWLCGYGWDMDDKRMIILRNGGGGPTAGLNLGAVYILVMGMLP